MYVREMHIEVNQAVQKIAANRTRKFLDEEIDWLLNKHQGRFIESRVTPKKDGSGGFEIRQFDEDAIRALVVRGYEAAAYVADPRSYSAILPGNYSYLLSDESAIKLAPLDNSNVPAVPANTTLTRNLLLIPVRRSTKPSAPYYGNVQLYLNGGLVFDIQQFTQARDTDYMGFNGRDQVYEVSHLLLLELSLQKWNIYWERYGQLYFPRQLIIDTGAVPATGSITIDGVTADGLSATTAIQIQDFPTQPTQDQNNRLTGSQMVQNLREVAFYRTQPESPMTELSGNLLHTYGNKYFIVTISRLSYVRKPRRISLTLGQDCELAPEFHQLVCDLTTEYIKAIIADPNWEVKLKDNMLRTPIE